jgi:hypothetical protein
MHSSKLDWDWAPVDHKMKEWNRVGPERKTKRSDQKSIMFFLGQIRHNWMTSE